MSSILTAIVAILARARFCTERFQPPLQDDVILLFLCSPLLRRQLAFMLRLLWFCSLPRLPLRSRIPVLLTGMSTDPLGKRTPRFLPDENGKRDPQSQRLRRPCHRHHQGFILLGAVARSNVVFTPLSLICQHGLSSSPLLLLTIYCCIQKLQSKSLHNNC